jgi:hypothetical protein
MSLSKSIKWILTVEFFQDKWRDEYFYDSMNRKALCLIFSESIAGFKRFTIQSIKKGTKTMTVL